MWHPLEMILSKLEVDPNQTASKATTEAGDKPTPVEARTWGVMAFFAVLPWSTLNIVSWTSGSMLLALGLTVPQAIGASIVANAIIMVSCMAGGHTGVKWRLSDPLSSRLVWGVRGYYVTLTCQVAITTCYYAIQLVYGYLCLKVVIGAMIPSFITMRNTFSTNLPTNDFICMIIFLAISAILQAFPIGAWTRIGKYAGALTMITFITIVAVCCGKANGVGPLLREPYQLVGVKSKPTSSQATWAFFLALSSLLAVKPMLYAGNYTRFSRNFSKPLPAQFFTYLVLPVLIMVFGILATSAAIVLFPEETRLLWAPYDLLLAFQKEGGPGTRAITFFAGVILMIPQLAINIAWNAYTTGINYSTLFPRYFTVRRGGYLTAILAVALNPWNFASKPSGFNRFLNGTGILWGCLCGMFLVDYFLIRRTNVKVSNLLNRDKTSIYWYYSGFNWRAFIAVLGTIWLPIPGWIMVIRKDESLLDGPWQKIYGLAWMLSFVTASSIYYILSRLWPMPNVREVDSEGELEEQPASVSVEVVPSGKATDHDS